MKTQKRWSKKRFWVWVLIFALTMLTACDQEKDPTTVVLSMATATTYTDVMSIPDTPQVVVPTSTLTAAGSNDLMDSAAAEVDYASIEPTIFDSGEINNCVVTEAGGVRCWGEGIGEPYDIQDLKQDVISVSVGGRNVCTLMEDSTVWCWITYGDFE